MRGLARHLLYGAFGLSLWACALDGAQSERPPVSSGEVRYVLDWSEESRALRQEDGRIKMITDLGYDVLLHEAYLVTSRTELVSCETNGQATKGVLRRFKDWLVSNLAVEEAHAGHGDMPDNVTAVDHSRVEDLLAMETLIWGSRELEGISYCQAHYLAGRADNTSEALPEEIDMTDRSIYLRGTAWFPGSGETVDFEGSTDLSNGVLSTLASKSGKNFVHSGNGSGLEILIVRDLARLLDGVDFATASSAAIGWRALDNMMLNLEIVGSSGP